MIFHNVVDSATLKEIYEAYANGDYRKGYLADALKNLNAKEGKVTIKITLWEDGEEDKDSGSTGGTSGSTDTSGNTTGNTGTSDNTGTGSTETESTEPEEEPEYVVEEGKEYMLTHIVVIE